MHENLKIQFKKKNYGSLENQTNHSIDNFNGVAEVRGLYPSGDHGLEQLRIVHSSVEIVALDLITRDFERV